MLGSLKDRITKPQLVQSAHWSRTLPGQPFLSVLFAAVSLASRISPGMQSYSKCLQEEERKEGGKKEQRKEANKGKEGRREGRKVTSPRLSK